MYLQKLAFIVALVVTQASCQVLVNGGVLANGGVAIGNSADPSIPQLPLVWADPTVCNPPGGTYDITKTIPGSYAATFAGIQQSMTDWLAAGDQWWHVVVTHGTLISGTGPFTLQAKAVGGGKPTKCIVYESDTPLTSGRTVCAHGIQDNLAQSTDPGVRNPDCNGTGMSYQLGNVLTTISAGPFTLANGTNTNTSNYNDVASMWTLECTNTNCVTLGAGAADVNGNGPNHIVIRDAEIRLASSVTCCTPIGINNGSATVAGNPSFIGLDRVWAHGDATDVGSGNNAIAHDFFVDCSANCWVENSQASKSIRPGNEGHTGYSLQAAGIKVVHNWFEGQSIGWFSGGAQVAASTTSGASIQDAEFRRNRFTYPFPWIDHDSGASSVCGANISCTRKNAEEMKGCVRCLFDGNIMENSDNSGGQSGTLWNMNIRACSTGTCNDYLQTIQDLTQTHNIVRHGCSGASWDAGSDNAGSGFSQATMGRRYLFAYNLLYDITFTDTVRCSGATVPFSIKFDTAGHNFAITSVTRDGTGTIATIVLTGGTGENQTNLSVGDPIWLSGCTDTTFNMGAHPYVLASTVSGLTITAPNVGTANASTTCTSFTTNAGWVQYLTVNHNTAQGDIQVNGPSSYSNQAGAVFPRNMKIINSIFAGAGGMISPGATEGTFFESHWTDTPTLVYHHNVVSERRAQVWQASTAYNIGQPIVTPTGVPARRWHAVSAGTSGSSGPAWCNTTNCCTTDGAGTLIWQEDGGLPATVGGVGGTMDYTEYDFVGATGTQPGPTLFFPLTDFSYGASATSTEIGYIGGLNTPGGTTNSCTNGVQVNYNPVVDLTDWHGYKLDTSSSFHAAASDGTDIGADINALDSAQTSTKYVCQTPCGTGPFSD